jgi:hypothetical protein
LEIGLAVTASPLFADMHQGIVMFSRVSDLSLPPAVNLHRGFMALIGHHLHGFGKAEQDHNLSEIFQEPDTYQLLVISPISRLIDPSILPSQLRGWYNRDVREKGRLYAGVR